MTWMEEVKRLPGEKDVINYFDIDTEKLTKTNQQKQELDGPRDRWSTKILVEKKLVVAQKALLGAFKRIISDNSMVPGCWLTETIVLLLAN